VPRLRFARDERGYENTFLLHTTRRRGKERTRVLYWFRSPPHVKVGRAAFDEDTIRALEEAHPELEFDWASILESRPPESEPEVWRDGRIRGGRERAPRSGGPELEHASVQIGDEAKPPIEPASDLVSDAVPNGALAQRQDDPIQRPIALDPSAAEQALGTEGLSRVRARHAEVLARITTQITDAAVADELRAEAESLNPDAWVTADDVRAGLENFERVLERLRQRLGRPRRRQHARAPNAGSHAVRSPS
jgi:hypothetical protein